MSAPRHAVSVVAALVITVTVFLGSFGTAGAQTEDPSSTDGDTTQAEEPVLVPGDGTEDADPATTTTSVRVEDGDDAVSESTQLWMVVAGLVVVAVLIGFWTWRYWKATAPEPSKAAQGGGGRSETVF